MRIATLLVSAWVLAIPSAVSASEACICGLGTSPLGIEAKDVPTNVKIFVTAGSNRATLSIAKVVNGMPQPIATHFEDAPEGTGDGWIVPDAPLDPMTTYEYVVGEIREQFTTGAGADTMAPTFSSAALLSLPMPGACEDHVSAALRAESGVDDSTTQGLWTWRINIKSPATTLYLPPQSIGYIGRMDTDDKSWESCLNNFQAAELDKEYTATLTALDWAGNASTEASTTFEFAAGGTGCGCHAVGHTESTEMSVLVGGALALFAFRRRRH